MKIKHYVSPSGLFAFYMLIGLLCFGQTAYPQTGERIAGVVVNGTSGQPVTGHPVSLERHTNETEAPQPVSGATTDAEGRFVFAGVPADGSHYVVTTSYQTLPYATGHIDLQAGAPAQDMRLEVFETTTEDTDLVINALHLVIEVSQNLLQVTEILVFQNNGQRTYVPSAEPGSGLALTLPAGAFQAEPMVEGVERTDQGLRFKSPVPPGAAQVVYGYQLDRSAQGSSFSRHADYPVGRVQVLISPSDQSVQSASLTNEGARQIGDKNYLLLSNATGLQRGMSVSLEFPGVIAWQDIMKWGIVGLVALMALGGALIGIKMRPPAEDGNARAALRDLTEEESGQFNRILDAMAALDDDYEAGRVEEKLYRRRRKELKNRVLKLRVEEAGDG